MANEAGWGSPECSIGGSDGVPTGHPSEDGSEREGAGPSGLEPAEQAEGDIGGVPTREPRHAEWPRVEREGTESPSQRRG